VKFVDVVAQNFAPASVGQSFAPTWSTHWFKVAYFILKIPKFTISLLLRLDDHKQYLKCHLIFPTVTGDI
jgi:hypothetical protein